MVIAFLVSYYNVSDSRTYLRNKYFEIFSLYTSRGTLLNAPILSLTKVENNGQVLILFILLHLETELI